ncbi:MAG: hypothetical protein HY308_06415 [Gammaproteobacteria bacterium]|nr:hypothetical protein [Gammaproteobacteria bacterium]
MTMAVSPVVPVGLQRRAGSLRWTEQLFLLCIALAVLIVVSRFVWPVEQIPYFEHLPLLLTLPLFTFTLIERRLSAKRIEPTATTSLRVAWPLALLTLFIVAGSGYARLALGVQTSFLNMGLYMGLTFAGASFITQSATPERIVHVFCQLLLWGALAMGVGLIVYFRRREVYHEEIFLVIPLAAYGLLQFRRGLARWGSVLFFLGLAALSAKNTSYLVTLLTASYLSLLFWWRDNGATSPVHRVWRYYMAFVVLLGAVVAAVLLLEYRETYLPSGNVEFRSHTYALAWERFLESPFWGTGFVVASVEKFRLYTVGSTRNVLPTHSDVMDLLANGGALGIGLWALGLIRIGRFAYCRMLASRYLSHPLAPYVHTLAVISLAAVITYSFNPIMLKPGMAYLVWISLGFLLGLALRSDVVRRSEE